MSAPRSIDGIPIVVPFLATLGTSNWFGTKMVAAAGVATEKVLIAPVDFYLAAGEFQIGPQAVFGDYIEFSVLSPADTLIHKYVSNLYVLADMRRKMESGRTATIPAQFKLKYEYFSVGPDPVDVVVDYQWFEG